MIRTCKLLSSNREFQPTGMTTRNEYKDKVTEGYRRLHRVTEGYRRLHRVTEGYRRLQKVTEGYIRLHKVIEGYRRFTSIKHMP